MTRWKLGDYHFNANTRRLHGAGRDVLLEPKAAALLAYFCEHPERNIGRDELLRSVWHGQVVSENSINRVIVLLRKALGDDEKARKYIATIPKLGYRLIAAVEPAQAATAKVADDVNEQLASPWPWGLMIASLGAVALVTFLSSKTAPPPPPREQQRLSITPLSRLVVTQSNADLASDGHTLLYTASDGERNQIYQVSATVSEPMPVSAASGSADFVRWAHGDAFAVYQLNSPGRCEFHRSTRAQFATRASEIIYECVPGSYTELSLSPDNTTLYFAERPTATAPYAVFALDLQKNSKRRLSQPVAQGYGNHYLDVHPGNGSLLLLSDYAPGKSALYALDPARESFALMQKLDYSLDSAIWSHRDGFVVHPSRHPSYQLVETSLATGGSEVIVSDSRRISGLRRIGAQDAGEGDYLFTSYLYNRDIQMPQFPAAKFNSAVMDYLPAISHARHHLAFISKRSGESQIWLKDFRDGRLTAIEPPDNGRRFLDLRWSADDRLLLANTNTGILVYSFEDLEFVHDIALPLPAYAVSWHDAQTLSFSHFEDQRFQAYRYRLDTGQREALDERWAFTVSNAKQQVSLDQTLAFFRDGRALTELSACAYPLWRAQLRIRLDGEAIYCHAGDAITDLLRFDAKMNMTRLEDVVERYEFFSVRDGQIATTKVVTGYSDIMRTRRPD